MIKGQLFVNIDTIKRDGISHISQLLLSNCQFSLLCLVLYLLSFSQIVKPLLCLLYVALGHVLEHTINKLFLYLLLISQANLAKFIQELRITNSVFRGDLSILTIIFQVCVYPFFESASRISSSGIYLSCFLSHQIYHLVLSVEIIMIRCDL